MFKDNASLLEQLLPNKDYPKTPNEKRLPTHWLFPEERIEFNRRPHRIFDESSILYTFNDHGYRCPDFKKVNEKPGVLSIGCSWTFGTGLPEQFTWPAILCNRISGLSGVEVLNWNLGMSGASNDYILRVLQQCVSLIKPKLAVIMFTDISRRDYISINGTYMNLNARMSNPKAMAFPERDIIKAFKSLICQDNDILHFASIYQAVESLMSASGIPWVFTSINKAAYLNDDCKKVSHIFSECRFLKKGPSIIDTARDHVHPGPKSMNQFVDSLFENTYFLEHCLGSLNL
jgi:hypothetical protein